MFINIDTMVLHIQPKRLISDLQKEFNEAFSFLKLEFFYNKNLSRSELSSTSIIPHNRKIGDGQTGNSAGEVELAGEMKVGELENIFQQKFGLTAQVFRKSGNLWLETSMTDNWTLQQQNNHGREISTKSVSDNKTDDYDLNRDSSH